MICCGVSKQKIMVSKILVKFAANFHPYFGLDRWDCGLDMSIIHLFTSYKLINNVI